VINSTIDSGRIASGRYAPEASPVDHDRAVARGRRSVPLAAVAYVGSWMAGLAVLPSGPAPHAAAADVSATLADHAPAAILQSWLVHGVAAIALVWFVRALLGLLTKDRAGDLVPLVTWTATLGAGTASLLQLAFLQVAVAAAGPATEQVAAAWMRAVNLTDIAKLVMLGVVVAGSTTMLARAGARWCFRLPSFGLAALLPVASLAFVDDAPVVGAMLALSLVLLLAWVPVAAVRAISLCGRVGPGPSASGAEQESW
jgi:hypothetical protein